MLTTSSSSGPGVWVAGVAVGGAAMLTAQELTVDLR